MYWLRPSFPSGSSPRAPTGSKSSHTYDEEIALQIVDDTPPFSRRSALFSGQTESANSQMSSPLIDILPDYWIIVRDILKKNVPQFEVWAFGSRAKWRAKVYSDLNLAIITDKPLPLELSAKLSNDFSESDLPWKVNVVDWVSTSETFRQIIEQDRVVVQKRKGWAMSNPPIIIRDTLTLERWEGEGGRLGYG